MMHSATPHDPRSNEMTSEKAKALELAIGQIDRHFGRGTVMRLGQVSNTRVEAISTGSVALDIALGVGGIPKGRVTEVFGSEGSGKSTLSYHIMASAQRAGGTAAYTDAEHALDASYAAKCGVNIEDLLVSQPDTAEQALEICEYLVRSGAVDVVVIDSVAALVPRPSLRATWGRPHGVASAPYVTGPSQADLGYQQVEYGLHLHQPAEGKGGCIFRKSGGDSGRTGPEVLQLRAHRPTQAGVHQTGGLR